MDLPVSDRPYESLGRRASRSSSNGSLGNHEPGLELSVAVAVLVAHLNPALDEGGGQRGAPGRLLKQHKGFKLRRDELNSEHINRFYNLYKGLPVVPLTKKIHQAKNSTVLRN